jgi:predicted dehydrogenase
MDYGSHAVAATWFLIGFDKVPVDVRSLRIEVKNRTRFIAGRLRPIEVDDDAHFKIRYVNPKNNDWITVHLEATWTWPEWGRDGSDVRGYIEIVGSEGTVTGYVDEADRDFCASNTARWANVCCRFPAFIRKTNRFGTRSRIL